MSMSMSGKALQLIDKASCQENTVNIISTVHNGVGLPDGNVIYFIMMINLLYLSLSKASCGSLPSLIR